MKSQVVYSSHKQSPIRMSSQNQHENVGPRNNVVNQGINGNKTFYQQNLLRNSSATQNIIENTTNYSFSKLNTRNISPNPASENQALRSKQSFGSDIKLQQIQFNYASPSQDQLKDAKEKESRAKSAGRNNIRARYISQNQRQNGVGNINTNIMNTQMLMNQLQSSTKNINDDELSNMKKSQQYRIKQNVNSSTKNMIDILGRTQMPQQASTKNNINLSEIDEANHTQSGIFLKKSRNNSNGGSNLPFRGKINASQGSGGSGAILENIQRSSQSQHYNITGNLHGNNQSLSGIASGNISNNISYVANMNQSSKNAENQSFVDMNIDNINLNNLTESQIRQTRINNLKNYIQNSYSSNTNDSSNQNPSQQNNSGEIKKTSTGTKSPNNQAINTNQGQRSSSQKNPQINKNQTNYGGYFQNNQQQEKIQPLKALHNFTDSDVQLSSQKNTQELSSGRVQNDKDITSSTTQGQKKTSSMTKQDSNLEDQQFGINDYLKNINSSLNYLKNIGQTYSTNTSSLFTQNITEKEANIEEMHFYAVEFQQNCKKWLSHIEDQKI
ncbi:hypothetical protein ABPG74_005438 [Tetrahymena malaccensis]